MNAAWTGPLLRDILIDQGLNVKSDLKYHDGLHVQMECNATKVQDDEWYGSSVPLGMVMDPEREVVLALDVSWTTSFFSSSVLLYSQISPLS